MFRAKGTVTRWINLTRGYIALVDVEDYATLSQYKWHALVTPRGTYARRCGPKVNGKRTYVLMHRQVKGVTDPTVLVDHEDHDGLNNRRHNLRVCTDSQNMRNSRKLCISASRFKGVRRSGRRWRAVIEADGKQMNVGTFSTEEEAALAYNAAAVKLHGAFAHLNQIDEEEVIYEFTTRQFGTHHIQPPPPA